MNEDRAWQTQPHRRRNALTGEWILVSPHRTQRPWQGETSAKREPESKPAYDPTCYLCPGNARAGGAHNPQYRGTFVFENDYAALRLDTPTAGIDEGGLLVAQSERGICRVVCFTPRHDLSIAQMPAADIRGVIDTWAEQYAELGALPDINSVIVFENHGEAMGASNPHPHAQIWANASIPNEPAKEQAAAAAYLTAHGTCLLCAYLAREIGAGERIVYANDHAVVVVPFWAVWPFETLVIPRVHATALDNLSAAARDGLAAAMQALTAAYDRVFDVPFPYSMGFHQRPTDVAEHAEWHTHAHYFPPLLRSATVRKYMVGYEMLGMPQRDITPESAAGRLRSLVARPRPSL
ncbi:MAG: UDP-glucose--hexose-1-phosphate uridylyltransferase [Candidatus Velthaea sp.]